MRERKIYFIDSYVSQGTQQTLSKRHVHFSYIKLCIEKRNIMKIRSYKKNEINSQKQKKKVILSR